MEGTTLGSLVKEAKGDDRSLRDYAKDSGVDAAIISKIINGAYAPKKPDIYLKLTSPQAAPRGDVTYEQLMEAASKTNTSRSYQAGIAAGMATTASLLTVVGGVPVASLAASLTSLAAAMAAIDGVKKVGAKKEKQKEVLTYNNDRLLEFEKTQKRFRAAALGMIITSLAKQGIACKVEDVAKLDLGSVRPDECLTISGGPISSWWFSFWAKDEELDERALVFREDRALVMLSRYTPVPADPERKVSLVVDDAALYDELAKYKDHNSYRGEMSIILVDQSSFEVIREEYVAHYDADTTRELHVV